MRARMVDSTFMRISGKKWPTALFIKEQGNNAPTPWHNEHRRILPKNLRIAVEFWPQQEPGLIRDEFGAIYVSDTSQDSIFRFIDRG